jgi:hypothetical protein
MDGKMARARRWKCEKFQHNSVSTKIGKVKSEKGFSLYPKRQREGHLDELQVSNQELEIKSQERGRPT